MIMIEFEVCLILFPCRCAYFPLLLHLVWHVTVNKLAGDMSLLHQNFSFSVYVLQTIQTNIKIINNKFEYLVV